MKICFKFLKSEPYLIPNKVGGTETYAKEIISYIQNHPDSNEYYLFCAKESVDLFSTSPNLKVITLPFFAKFRPIRLFVLYFNSTILCTITTCNS